MNSVLEHIQKPTELLLKVHKNLNDKGFLFIGVPTYNTPLRKILGKRWYLYALHEHYWYFDEKNPREIVERAGYKTVAVQNQCNFYNPKSQYWVSGLLIHKSWLQIILSSSPTCWEARLKLATGSY